MTFGKSVCAREHLEECAAILCQSISSGGLHCTGDDNGHAVMFGDFDGDVRIFQEFPVIRFSDSGAAFLSCHAGAAQFTGKREVDGAILANLQRDSRRLVWGIQGRNSDLKYVARAHPIVGALQVRRFLEVFNEIFSLLFADPACIYDGFSSR